MRFRGMRWGWAVVVSGAAVTLGACAGDGDGDDADDAGGRATETSRSVVTSEPVTSPSADHTSLTPVPKALDQAAVEKSVRSVLRGSYGIADVESVSCPAAEPVRVGNTFDCTARIGGEPARVPIEILDEDGRYEVGLPV
ncbi:hypothetical protein B1813_01795 [Saccharomonospora piscinae]|uniref:DUF4333 domain-containing protein n=1 Tax=Saccharomonospora piscinae TaxID=687388 RepID=A0A1V9ADF6_SACPI|nr:DUF4333 domain-containing protein [Saccharomonospora piscinae]OQO95155.1 hypothetical protein B1813_01795 [Saccharomonospora piscinae]